MSDEQSLKPTLFINWIKYKEVPRSVQTVLDLFNGKGTIDGYEVLRADHLAVIRTSDKNTLVYTEHNDRGTVMTFHSLILQDESWEYVGSSNVRINRTEHITNYVYPVLLCENVVGFSMAALRVGIDKIAGAFRILEDGMIVESEVKLCEVAIVPECE